MGAPVSPPSGIPPPPLLPGPFEKEEGLRTGQEVWRRRQQRRGLECLCCLVKGEAFGKAGLLARERQLPELARQSCYCAGSISWGCVHVPHPPLLDIPGGSLLKAPGLLSVTTQRWMPIPGGPRPILEASDALVRAVQEVRGAGKEKKRKGGTGMWAARSWAKSWVLLGSAKPVWVPHRPPPTSSAQRGKLPSGSSSPGPQIGPVLTLAFGAQEALLVCATIVTSVAAPSTSCSAACW